jgi:hypothetical protein
LLKKPIGFVNINVKCNKVEGMNKRPILKIFPHKSAISAEGAFKIPIISIFQIDTQSNKAANILLTGFILFFK